MAREFFDTVATKAGLAGEYEELIESEFAASAGPAYTPGEDGIFRVVASRTIQLLKGSPIYVETFQDSAATLRVPSGLIASNDANDGRFYFVKNSGIGNVALQDHLGGSLAAIRKGQFVVALHGDDDNWDASGLLSSDAVVEVKNTLTTTDTLLNTIATIDVDPSTVHHLDVTITAREGDNNRGSFVRKATIYRNSTGGAAIENNVIVVFDESSSGNFKIAVVASGNSILIQVQDEQGQTVNWTSWHKLYSQA